MKYFLFTYRIFGMNLG